MLSLGISEIACLLRASLDKCVKKTTVKDVACPFKKTHGFGAHGDFCDVVLYVSASLDSSNLAKFFFWRSEK